MSNSTVEPDNTPRCSTSEEETNSNDASTSSISECDIWDKDTYLSTKDYKKLLDDFESQQGRDRIDVHHLCRLQWRAWHEIRNRNIQLEKRIQKLENSEEFTTRKNNMSSLNDIAEKLFSNVQKTVSYLPDLKKLLEYVNPVERLVKHVEPLEKYTLMIMKFSEQVKHLDLENFIGRENKISSHEETDSDAKSDSPKEEEQCEIPSTSSSSKLGNENSPHVRSILVRREKVDDKLSHDDYDACFDDDAEPDQITSDPANINSSILRTKLELIITDKPSEVYWNTRQVINELCKHLDADSEVLVKKTMNKREENRWFCQIQYSITPGQINWRTRIDKELQHRIFRRRKNQLDFVPRSVYGNGKTCYIKNGNGKIQKIID